jgi:hypothetical protein
MTEPINEPDPLTPEKMPEWIRRPMTTGTLSTGRRSSTSPSAKWDPIHWVGSEATCHEPRRGRDALRGPREWFGRGRTLSMGRTSASRMLRPSSGLMLRRGAPHLVIRRLRRIPVEPARGGSCGEQIELEMAVAYRRNVRNSPHPICAMHLIHSPLVR